MVPPTSRRSGFSRKAQYSVFTGYLLAAIGVVAGGLLLLLTLNGSNLFSGLRGTATDVAAPVGKAGANGRVGVQGFFGSLIGYFNAGSQNAKLREEVEIARIRLKEAEAIKAENRRLKELLQLGQGDPKAVAAARLIGSTSASTRRFAYISAGKDHGVAPGMPVRSPRGLVGRVLDAGSRTARVILLTDSESMVPVRRAGDNVVAFAEGRSEGSLRIRLIDLGINPLKKGDVFVTSGAGGLFRPGIAVGIATEITRDGAIARLLSDPAATDFVIVEPIWEAELQPAPVIESGTASE